LKVVVTYCPAPRQVREWVVDLPDPPAGNAAKQAVMQCGVLSEFADLSLDSLKLGIWGKRCSLNQTLKDMDRIEIYRPLRVDPKVARRERFTRQGAKRAGLFATKRVGAKAGYGG
jgi:putative ubiquitin-RnfH superfamily antitoxin RatB of RatAB toxin-antitoxin module